MPLTPNTSILLYAPFDKDNPGSTELKRKMTPKEFFEECFVYPNFDEKIQSLANSSNSEIDEHEVFLTKEEMIENLSNDKDGLDIFEKWLKDNASSPYVIMGDAGTGKTTLLHYYQYKNKGKHNWTILDLQEANRDIQIYNKLLCIEKKDTLKEMISSILIKEIVKILFMNRDGQKHNDKEIFKNILNIKKAFFVDNKHLLPLETTTLFFEKLPIIPFIYSKKFFKRLIIYIYSFLEDILDYSKHEDPFEQVFDLYLNILDTQSKNESTVIVVDNVERFIKTTEIYSDDIIAFMKTLRNITERHRSNSTINNINYFAEKFRFIISMRKTTIRLFNLFNPCCRICYGY